MSGKGTEVSSVLQVLAPCPFQRSSGLCAPRTPLEPPHSQTEPEGWSRQNFQWPNSSQELPLPRPLQPEVSPGSPVTASHHRATNRKYASGEGAAMVPDHLQHPNTTNNGAKGPWECISRLGNEVANCERRGQLSRHQAGGLKGRDLLLPEA